MLRLFGQLAIALGQPLPQPIILSSQPLEVLGRQPLRYASDGTQIRRLVQDRRSITVLLCNSEQTNATQRLTIPRPGWSNSGPRYRSGRQAPSVTCLTKDMWTNPSPAAQSESLRVLWIDDDQAVLQYISKLLGIHHFLVDGVTSVAEGLCRACSGSYALIGLEIDLPDGSGLSILKHVRRHQIDTPVFVLTACFAEDAVISEAWLTGANDCRAKPLIGRPLIEALERVVALHAIRVAQHTAAPADRDTQTSLGVMLDELYSDLAVDTAGYAAPTIIARLQRQLLLATVGPTTTIPLFCACARAFRRSLALTKSQHLQLFVVDVMRFLQEARAVAVLHPHVEQAMICLGADNPSAGSISEQSLALTFRRDPSHFGRQLKMQTGLDIREWKTMRRLRSSVRELAAGQEHLKQIAQHAGWSSVNQFNHKFTELFGATPTEIRKRVAEARAQQ